MSTFSRRNFLGIMGVVAAEPPLLARLMSRMPSVDLLTPGAPPEPAAPAADPVVRGNARFHVLSPSLLRIEYSPSASFVDARSVSLGDVQNWPAPRFTAKDVDGWVEIATDAVTLRYKLNSGPFTADNLVATWASASGDKKKTWKPGDKDDQNLGGVPGDIAKRTKAGNEPGPLSRKGCFLLDDSPIAVWNTTAQWPEPRAKQDGTDWYLFVYDTDYKQFFQDATKLLGPAPMPPAYILGGWFGSRAGYSSDEWKRIVRRFREEQIPLDMVILDSDSTASFTFAGLDFDRQQMPDRKAFFAWMKERGIYCMVNEHYGDLTPENAQDDNHFERIREGMGLPAGTRKIKHDLADKKYAKLYMDVLHKQALEDGMALWWQDGNAASSMPGLDPVLWTRHIEYAGTEEITGRRSFVLCRLGTPPWGGDYPAIQTTPAWGGHRYGAFFAGDLSPVWSSLELLSDFMARAGNMLLPYVATLTAGIWKLVVDTELYQRWVQFSAFNSIFWWHGYWGLRMPWEYGTSGVDTVRRFLDLRYRLMPYTYTQARLAHDTGVPILRGTYIEYPKQEKAYQIKQQYLFGADILVAPIYTPGAGKPVARQVYLPANEHWHDFFTGDVYVGGDVIHYECPLERMPVFVRAGAVIPMGPERDYTGQRPNDPLTIHAYAGQSGSFRLYEDDGQSLDYRQNGSAWTLIQYEENNRDGRHTIRIDPAQGQYKGQPASRRYRMCVHGLGMPTQVTLGQRVLPHKWTDQHGTGWSWDELTGVTTIDLDEPISVRSGVAVTLQGAARFADMLAAQQARQFRDRVRSLKPIIKIRWSSILGWTDQHGEPRSFAETGKVEEQINAMLDNPVGLGTRSVDYRGMAAGLLSAFSSDAPLEVTRTVPDLDEESQLGNRKLKQGHFTTEERRHLVANLLGCRLLASLDAPKTVVDFSAPVIRAALVYDKNAIGEPKVEYELDFPESNGPGWFEVSREMKDGAMEFTINSPYPTPIGTYTILVRAIATWPNAQTVVERPVAVTVSADQ